LFHRSSRCMILFSFFIPFSDDHLQVIHPAPGPDGPSFTACRQHRLGVFLLLLSCLPDTSFPFSKMVGGKQVLEQSRCSVFLLPVFTQNSCSGVHYSAFLSAELVHP
jgi:hypothetical protein